MRHRVLITYTDKFIIDGPNKDAIRKAVRKNWYKFGMQFEKLRFEQIEAGEKETDITIDKDGELVE